MRKQLLAVLAYSGATLTLVLAILTPFVLMGFFSNVVAHAGLHVDTVYSGGAVVRTVARDGYQIAIHQVVRSGVLNRTEPFIQMTWNPVSALPAKVSDEVDLDGDGTPDVRVTFAVPTDPDANLQAEIVSLNASYSSMQGVEKQSFSEMVVRTGNAILVRVPVRKAAGK